MIIDKALLDEVTAKAKASERLRMHYDLRTCATCPGMPEDNSQRMLNAMEPGTVLPVHRHRFSNETVVVLRGRFRQNFFDDSGRLTETFVAGPGLEVTCFCIEAGRWHNSESLESGTVIFECKDGKYRPIAPEDILTV